jgi:hypothetical protein
MMRHDESLHNLSEHFHCSVIHLQRISKDWGLRRLEAGCAPSLASTSREGPSTLSTPAVASKATPGDSAGSTEILPSQGGHLTPWQGRPGGGQCRQDGSQGSSQNIQNSPQAFSILRWKRLMGESKERRLRVLKQSVSPKLYTGTRLAPVCGRGQVVMEGREI